MAKLSKYIELQDTILRELQVEFNEFQNAIAERKSRGYVKACLNDVEDTYKRAKTQHSAIINSAPDALKDKYVEDETFTKIKRIFFKFSGLIDDDLETLAEQGRASSDVSHLNITKSCSSDIRLPRLQIKPFSGKYEDWSEFHNLFENLIDQNADLSDVQKLQHLKNSVTGEAARLIQHLPLDGKNYASAREILTERFENKRKLVNTQLRILIDQEKLTHESAASLKSLHDTSAECFHALANLKIPVDTWDAILVYIIFHKLPPQTQRDWEAKLGTCKVLPEWKTFLSFIEARFTSLENISELNVRSTQHGTSGFYRKPMAKTFHISSLPVNKKFPCRLCKTFPHGIRHCKQFLRMDVRARYDTIKKHSICANCLGYDHHMSTCTNSKRCFKCGLKHHTMLHIESQYQRQNSTQHNPHTHLVQNTNFHESVNSENIDIINPSTSVNTHLNQMRSRVLLATALVKIVGPKGTSHVFRALIDPGSEATFVTENVVQLLSLRRQRQSASVTGLGRTPTGSSQYQVEFSIRSLTNTEFGLEARAYVFPQLTSMLPAYQTQTNKWKHLENLPLADPSYSVPGKIDLLIGADLYSYIILKGLIKSQGGSPIAQRTELGWILTGPIGDMTIKSNHLKIQTHFNCLEELKAFWEIEENLDERKLSQEEEQCQIHYQRTVRRSEDGRYVVSLPFKDDSRPNLGNSKNAALARLYQIEKRLRSDEKVQNDYHACIKEYETLGHMKDITEEVQLTTGTHYFLPHHAVIKESSSTTKLRVVFDASCKTSSGRSLNDCLMVGPRLQADIIDLITSWRKFKVAFAADINKMYRQIWISPEDTPYQLMLWRASSKDPIRTFALKTVTFGTASAPYLAVRTLHQLAAEVEGIHPHVSKVLTEGFYVDDLIYGADNDTDAIKLQSDLRDVLISAGFALRKWVSNSQKVLQQVPENDREINLPLKFDSPESIKTLGIQWHPAKDVFEFKINLPEITRHTKRTVLADIARLFDPLGWISPCIIRAKLILQQLWLRKLSWDDNIPQDIENIWLDLRYGLLSLKNFQIPRWIEFEEGAQVQLHGFSDASERAYAAVVYARVVKNNRESVSLLASKTRVSPSAVKCITLPRLELCAALLLAKLLHRINKAMQFDNAEIFAWSDSMITLAWIKGSPAIRTTFVANRVTEIQQLINPNAWRHVNSKENPADCASRGASPEEVCKSQIWWNGPNFLRKFSLKEWPVIVPVETESETKIKQKTNQSFPNNNLNTYLQNLPQNNPVLNSLLQKHSTLKSIVRSMAIWRRYIHNLRHPEERTSLYIQPIAPDELGSAHDQLIRLVQNEMFGAEISVLKERGTISKKSGILSLNPFLDSEGLLRVGGRLTNAPLTFNQRHPLILKDSHTVTKLIVSNVHQNTLHGGQQLMMAEIRNTYWITNLKRLVKSTIYKCIRCHRYHARMQQQLMGSLPVERVTISRPFTNTGVDYAGPIEIKLWKGRCNKIAKGYIAVFICLSTKAIHIELVSDLSAASFIAAFRRFTARREICANIFSDCGTNFKGASNELNRDRKFITTEWSSEVANTLASHNTKWHFNPPCSPHFGGLWEAGVKSIKHHLKRTIGASKLTFEEYATLLTQIEACLNSRPLCPMSSDPDDLSVLTPGHFLIGTALHTHPERNLYTKKVNNLDRWNYIQRLTQEFWKQWSASYIHLLQQRPKWMQQTPNIKIGDIVLVKEDNLPPSSWLLARVLEVHVGLDGLTRVVTIKTKNSVLKRPIAKLSPLPISNPSTD